MKNVCVCVHVSDGVHVTVCSNLCVGGGVQLCIAFKGPTSLINKLSLLFMTVCVVYQRCPLHCLVYDLVHVV